MKNITKNTKIELRTESLNANTSGSAIVEAGQLFNFDGFLQDLSKEQAEFVSSLSHKEFKEIPSEMLDSTTAANFRCYIRLAK